MRKNNAGRKFGSAILSAAMLVSSVSAFSLTVLAQEKEPSRTNAETSDQVDTAVVEHPVQSIELGERSIDFNENWSFYFGEASGADQPLYDDSKWEVVNVPHDFSITQDYGYDMEGESAYKPGGIGWYRKTFTLSEDMEDKDIRIDFDGVYMNSTVYINGHKLGDHPYGYTPFSYDLTPYLNRKGVNTIAVRVNHQTPSSRWYSGSGITRQVKLTATNQVAVALYGTQITSPNLETEYNGDVTTNVKTTVNNTSNEQKTVSVRQSLYVKGQTAGTPVAVSTDESVTLAADSSQVVEQNFVVNKPTLWSVAKPNEKAFLYTVVTTIYDENGDLIDSYDTEYGYRYFNFDANTGFSLNGESMKLQGVCMHHDQGALGSVDTRRAVERQVEILKEGGVNAIRTSHNPASQNLIDVCNEQGVVLMEEIFDGWDQHKNGNTNDYAGHFSQPLPEDSELINAEGMSKWAQFDLTQTLLRGRNSPAIMIWDIGNEVEHGSTSHFPQIARELCQWIKELDDRPMVLGDNKTLFNDTNVSTQMRPIIVEAGGLVGSNYGLAPNLQTLYRNDHPEWKFLGTENMSAVNSRGIYNRVGSQSDLNGDRQLTSYDYSAVSWGHVASQELLGLEQNDWFAGQFVWTGFDYLGEPTPWNGIYGTEQAGYGWPAPKNSYFGFIDTAGFPKDTYYLYRSLWNRNDTTLHMLPAWRSDVVYKGDSRGVPVVVYTNAHKVKLQLTTANGTVKDLGTKEFTEKVTANGRTYRMYEGTDKESIEHRNLYLTWYVPYEDGTITATAYDVNGNVISETVGRNQIETFGDAAKLKATADRNEVTADGRDLIYVTVDVLDEQDREVANADDRVTFSVEGPAKLVGVDNGSSPDQQAYTDDNRKAFSGKVLAIVETTKEEGEIRITASSDGLESDTVVVNSVDAPEKSSTKVVSAKYSDGCFVNKGVTPKLPQTADLTYEDGSVKTNVPITWEDFDLSNVSSDEPVTVNGTAANAKLTFRINVIDNVGAVQNYSTVVQKGSALELPENRPVLRRDGSIMPIFADVEWEDYDSALLNSEGTFTVKGTASLLGVSYPVSASIRVATPVDVPGQNVVPNVGYRITQNIPDSQASDNLLSIKDGNPTPTAKTGIWSNYNAVKSGNRDVEIKIYLDTAQNISTANLYFVKDEYSLVWPDAGDVTISWSATGEEGSWTVLDAEETISEETLTNGTCVAKNYQYTFEPTAITVFKINFTTKDGAGPTAGEKATSALSEVELIPVTSVLQTGTSTDIASLKINGKEETIANPSASELSSYAHLIDSYEIAGTDNANVTKISEDEKSMLFFVESEDHSKNRLVTVKIQKPYARDPESDEYTLPVTGLTASATSVYAGSNEGPAANVLDNNTNTWYHTDWSNSSGSKEENRHVDLTFDEPTEVAALRYLPRNSAGSGGRNGQVTSYRIQYKTSDDGQWMDIASGDWTYTTGWKVAEFDEPVVAKAVRFIGVHTYTNGALSDTDMSAAEIRLCTEFPKTDIQEAAGFQVNWPDSIGDSYVEGTDLHSLIEVTADQKLYYGTDYYFEYVTNPKTNELTIELKGNAEYGGTVSKTYKLESIITFDTSLLEWTVSAARSILEEPDRWTSLEALKTACETGEAVLASPTSQDEINETASRLNQVMMAVRLKPDPDALAALK